MKCTIFILFSAILLTGGCIARKVVPVPAAAAVKTTLKATGKVAKGSANLILPDEQSAK